MTLHLDGEETTRYAEDPESLAQALIHKGRLADRVRVPELAGSAALADLEAMLALAGIALETETGSTGRPDHPSAPRPASEPVRVNRTALTELALLQVLARTELTAPSPEQLALFDAVGPDAVTYSLHRGTFTIKGLEVKQGRLRHTRLGGSEYRLGASLPENLFPPGQTVRVRPDSGGRWRKLRLPPKDE